MSSASTNGSPTFPDREYDLAAEHRVPQVGSATERIVAAAPGIARSG
jgi:hypothetical protein